MYFCNPHWLSCRADNSGLLFSEERIFLSFQLFAIKSTQYDTCLSLIHISVDTCKVKQCHGAQNFCFCIILVNSGSVSYTHLDVYKRQAPVSRIYFQFGVELGYNLVDSDTCDNRCVAVLLYCISFDEIE